MENTPPASPSGYVQQSWREPKVFATMAERVRLLQSNLLQGLTLDGPNDIHFFVKENGSDRNIPKTIRMAHWEATDAILSQMGITAPNLSHIMTGIYSSKVIAHGYACYKVSAPIWAEDREGNMLEIQELEGDEVDREVIGVDFRWAVKLGEENAAALKTCDNLDGEQIVKLLLRASKVQMNKFGELRGEDERIAVDAGLDPALELPGTGEIVVDGTPEAEGLGEVFHGVSEWRLRDMTQH